MNINIEEIKKQRFQFLYTLYEASGGIESKLYSMYDIGKELGFDKKLTEKIEEYLRGEWLTKIVASQGLICITHLGIKEIEEALSEPDTPTKYFPAVNIITIGQMTNSQIQQNSPGAVQIISMDEDNCNKIKEIIQSLNNSIEQFNLTSQQENDAQAEIKTIEAQMTSSKPKPNIITECLKSIRVILEGVASNVIAVELLSKIKSLLEA